MATAHVPLHQFSSSNTVMRETQARRRRGGSADGTSRCKQQQMLGWFKREIGLAPSFPAVRAVVAAAKRRPRQCGDAFAAPPPTPRTETL